MSLLTVPDPSSSIVVREVLGDDVAAFQAARRKIQRRRKRNLIRDFYVEGEQAFKNMGIAIPPSLELFATAIAWPAKSISVVVDRLAVDMFTLPDQTSPDGLMQDVFADNHMMSEQSQLHTASLQHGPAFLSVCQGRPSEEEPEVLLRTYSAKEATGHWNPRLRRLDQALTIDETTEHGLALEVNWWTRDRRVRIRRATVRDQWEAETLPHKFSRCPVVLFPYDAAQGKPFGRSRITRPIMTLTDQAARTSLRSEISAEFFSSPQRYLLGADEEAFLDENGDPKSAWESIIGHLLVISRQWNEEKEQYVEGNPTAGQFPQQSMQPHSEQLRTIAMQFSGAADIPVAYLGIIQDNPSSADAIRQLEQPLVSKVEGAQRSFWDPWADVARLSAQVHAGSSTMVDEYRRVNPYWHDASTPTQAATTAAVSTLIQNGVLQPDSEVTYRMMRFDEATKATLRAEAAARRSREALQALRQSTPDPEAQALVAQRS